MAGRLGNHVSQMGEQFGPALISAISRQEVGVEHSDPTTSEGRMVAAYKANSDALDEVSSRVSAWLANGHVLARASKRSTKRQPNKTAKTPLQRCCSTRGWGNF